MKVEYKTSTVYQFQESSILNYLKFIAFDKIRTLCGKERATFRLKGLQRLYATATEGTRVLQLACS